MKIILNIALTIGMSLFLVGCGEEKESTEEITLEEPTETHKKKEPKTEEPQKTENLEVVVHMDDVTDVPNYSIETYKEGDEMPAANGMTMNCTYPTCYKVVFDVNGSGQNPTPEYQALESKLQDRNILDDSSEGVPTIFAEYWTKDGMITSRFYE